MSGTSAGDTAEARSIWSQTPPTGTHPKYVTTQAYKKKGLDKKEGNFDFCFESYLTNWNKYCTVIMCVSYYWLHNVGNKVI